MNALVPAQRRSAPTGMTELSDAARELLPEGWRSETPPLSGDDWTAFHYYALPVQRISPVHRTRTWLKSEIDALSEQLTSLATEFETFAEIYWDLPTPRPRDMAPSLRLRALAAVRQLMEVLGLPETHVAELAGVSRNSVRNWRNGQNAYPSTVKRLFQIANLLTALESAMGRERLVTWLDERHGRPISRRELLTESHGPAEVAREAGRILFQRPASTLPSPELLDLDDEPEDEEAAYAPQAFAARPRRQRPNAT